jgi:subfamily B ATP-binding cassette protein MsbA
MAVVGATAGITAWLVKPVLDDIFINKDVWKLQMVPVALLALYFTKGVCRYAQSYVMRWVGEKAILQMRVDFMANLQYRALAFFDQNSTGRLMAMVTSDVGNMQQAIPALIQMARTVFTLLGLLFVLFFRDWKLALLAVVVFPLAAYPLRRIGVLIRSYSRRSQERVGDLSNVLQEAFSGIEVVKSFRSEQREISRFRNSAEHLLGLGMKHARLNEATAPMIEFVGAIGAALIIWYGGRQVLTGAATPGEFFSFLAALFMLYDPLKRTGMLGNQMQTAIASAERVFAVMDQPLAGCECGGTLVLDRDIRDVTLEDVHFHYVEDKDEVLRGVSLVARRGQIVALVGLSGGGKSTVLKLLPRFYDPQSGAVRINGTDVREYTLESLRDAIALVTQDTFLFNDTVRANILVGRLEADEESVVAAAKAAHAHEFIAALPQGYDTVVGERGDLLSGGQRQRIAIARAILKDAPILLLDEATSALDSASEKAVQAALETLMKGRTSFVIAHRLATVRHADQIHVIQDGVVVESGNHEVLLARGGEYARFCRLQFAGEKQPGSPAALPAAPPEP